MKPTTVLTLELRNNGLNYTAEQTSDADGADETFQYTSPTAHGALYGFAKRVELAAESAFNITLGDADAAVEAFINALEEKGALPRHTSRDRLNEAKRAAYEALQLKVTTDG